MLYIIFYLTLNLKVGITKHTYQTLILNPTYKDMANHYNTVVMPARVRTPVKSVL
ncbi:hypothetical protein GCM10008936_07680 [Alkalibacterium indicireducens]|uniref:Uncharacterized protein n=1 Tax=Alkalibacterium indicireducens TaxID=398758 RepID=A0ABP3KHX4_9LACT